MSTSVAISKPPTRDVQFSEPAVRDVVSGIASLFDAIYCADGSVLMSSTGEVITAAS